jgi:nitrilase
LVVDPWGEIVACRDEGEGVVTAELSRDRIASVRSQLPALEHRLAF